MAQGTLEPLIATRIELLIGALGAATKDAECVGVTRPLLSKWREWIRDAITGPAEDAGGSGPRDGSFRLDLRPRGRDRLAFRHNSYLEGARPIDVLRVRRVQATLDALDAGAARVGRLKRSCRAHRVTLASRTAAFAWQEPAAGR